MNLAQSFYSLKDQLDFDFESRLEAKREEIKEKNPDFSENALWDLEDDENLVTEIKQSQTRDFFSKTLQLKQLKMISHETWKGSRKFDIDFSSNQRQSPFDKMVEDNVLQKSLENDNLLVVEGFYDTAPEIFTAEQIQLELAEEERALSSGDFDDDLDAKIKIINDKNLPK